MKTKIQIIDETVEFYSKNPRAIDDKTKPEGGPKCQYLTSDGNQCAHSRCLTDEARTKVVAASMNGYTANDLIERFDDNIHKEEYRGHDSEFWCGIQSIHDSHTYWNGQALTARGKQFVETLKERYQD